MIILTWPEVMELTLTLAKMLEGKKVYGIPRGGTIVAGLLSYHGCELVTTSPHQLFKLNLCMLPKYIVIVDDVADKGDTLGMWQRDGSFTAALLARHSCIPFPNCTARVINTDDYVLFPWEDPEKAKELETNGKFKDHSK